MKRELRKLMKEREKEFLASGRSASSSAAVFRAVEKRPDFAAAKCVLCYMSIPGEVETGEFISRWYGRKRIVIPRVEGERLILCEHEPSKLRPGYLGILEPSDDALKVDASEIDLALIPGVAFSRLPDGGAVRLGHGKGFYDRLLPELDCPKIGLGFSFRIVEHVPSDPWDIPLDDVIVEG